MSSVPTTNVEDVLARATSAHQEGDLEAASALYLKVLETQPTNADALHRAGLLFLEQGDYQTAHRFLEQALAVRPHDPAFCNHFGVALLNLGQTESAMAYFNDAIARDGQYMEARLNLAISQRATDQLLAAWDTIVFASQADPTNATVLIWRGRIERECGYLQEALESLTAAVEMAPQNTEALGLLGDVMIDLGDPGMAERCYRQALEVDGALVNLRMRLANCLSGVGRDDEARAEYEFGLEIDGDNGALWGAMALLLSRTGDDEAALSAAKRAVDLDAGNVDGHNTLAAVYARLGDETSAAAAQAMVGQLTDRAGG